MAGRHAGGDEPAETTTVKALLKRRSSCLSHFTLKWNNTAVILFPFVQVNEAGETCAQPQTVGSKETEFSFKTRSPALWCVWRRSHSSRSHVRPWWDPRQGGAPSARTGRTGGERVTKKIVGSPFPDVQACCTGNCCVLMWWELGADRKFW